MPASLYCFQLISPASNSSGGLGALSIAYLASVICDYKGVQEPGEALADAMRRYGDKASQALADSIYSGVQFGFAVAPRRHRFP